MRLGMGLRLSDILKHGAAGYTGTLLNGMVSYWALDEESGTRYDAVGSNHLTDNNTVGFDTGKNGNAASFIATNGESLTLAAALQAAPKTYSFWYKSGGGATTERILKDKGTYIDIYHDSGSNFLARATVNDGVGYPEASTGFVIKALGWVHVVVSVAAAVGGIAVYVNYDEFSDTENLSAEAGAEAFTLNADNDTTCVIDEVAIWSRVLTSDERTELYNSGSGFFYPFT